MRRNYRWLAAIVTASVVLLASSAAATAAPRTVSYTSNPCPQTFTAWMFKRAAVSFYKNKRVLTHFDRSQLRKFMRCSRQLSDKPIDVRLWHQALEANWKRRHPPVVYPESALAVCIIYRESRGDMYADNGTHFGLAQWSIESWLGGGGGRYASNPLGATYSEQVTILNDMLPAQAEQWTPWDGCT